MEKTDGITRIIDLSVPILPTPPGAMLKVEIEYSSHEEGAKRDGAYFGISPEDLPDGRFAAVEIVTLTTHSGTHLDAPYHYGPFSEGKPARRIDEVPLEWCFGDGVVLDFTYKRPGDEIGIDDYKDALKKIGYNLKPFDIVLVMTGASKYYGQSNYGNMHPGNTRESTIWLVEQGIKVMGIDAWGWDRPFNVMVDELKKGIKNRIWAAHLDKIPTPFGFKVAVFPIKVPKAGGAWVRAVAFV